MHETTASQQQITRQNNTEKYLMPWTKQFKFLAVKKFKTSIRSYFNTICDIPIFIS